MVFDKLYQDNDQVWGDAVNRLVALALNNFKPGSSFLDLGCGQGKDALFMARKGFRVTAVDSAEAAIKQLDTTARAEGLENLEAINADIEDYVIQKNRFDIVLGNNVLQFLRKDESLAVIEKIKENIAPGGFVLLASFTVDDALYDRTKKQKMFFERQEMASLFEDFKIMHYFEGLVLDQGHPGMPETHQHGVARIIAQKIA